MRYLRNTEKGKIGCTTPGQPSGSHGTRAVLSRIGVWRLQHRAGGPGRRVGCEYLPSESPRLAPAHRDDYGASTELALKGLEFDVGHGGSGSGPGPTMVATGRRRRLATAHRSVLSSILGEMLESPPSGGPFQKH